VAVVTAPKLTVTVPIVLPEEEGFLGNEWLGCGDGSNVKFDEFMPLHQDHSLNDLS
jgi:hypothetical protein